MKYLFLCFLVLIAVCTPQTIHGQTDTWVEANQGLADFSKGETFTVLSLTTLENGRVFVFIRDHTGGEAKNGVYEYNKNTEQWEKSAPALTIFGFFFIANSGTKIFAAPGGAGDKKVFELDPDAKKWIERGIIPDFGLTDKNFALGDKIYFACDISADQKLIDAYPEKKFQKFEEFVLEFNTVNAEVKLLRNPNKPLVITSKGGTTGGPAALKNGKVYHYSAFDYRDTDGYGGLYEWDGSDWQVASQGLDAINITGNAFGTVGPLYTNSSREKLFVVTQQGLFEKTEGGWYKYFFREGNRIFISKDFLFLNNQDGSFTKVDRALKQDFPGRGPECIKRNQYFITPDNGLTFFAELKAASKNAANQCSTDEKDIKTLGIYKYVVSNTKEGRVQNLHLETATYLGTAPGENHVYESMIMNDGKILVAGSFNGVGKILKLNATATLIEQQYEAGTHIYDMAKNANEDIAIIGNFGIKVLASNLTTQKWEAAVQVSTDFSGASTGLPRISIADNGYVVASIRVNNKATVRLYNATGTKMHDNVIEPTGDSRKIKDVEISSAPAHNKYYICGFQQANANLQVAFVYGFSFETTDNPPRALQTWGFGIGGPEGLQLSDNGADTRIYRMKATADKLYVIGESAGGGPGGFTIFAYNGKNLSTQTALEGNDYFSDGTFSCGSCHITYMGIINPSSGEVEKGKFLHARLPSGKTNTHKVDSGDLEVDSDYVYITGTSAYAIQDRDVFNVNGQLTGRYTGDQYVLMLTKDLQKRLLWGVLSKENASGLRNSIAIGNGKVAYVSTTDRGLLFTTKNAIKATPYNTHAVAENSVYGNLDKPDVYLALWNAKVWETANNDSLTYPFISKDSCFRADDKPCRTSSITQEDPKDIVEVSNIISPNGDRQNDTWKIEGLQLTGKYQVRVFNKAGQVIFESVDYNKAPWNGTHNGKQLPDGVYYYIITFEKSNTPKTGYITLIH